MLALQGLPEVRSSLSRTYTMKLADPRVAAVFETYRQREATDHERIKHLGPAALAVRDKFLPPIGEEVGAVLLALVLACKVGFRCEGAHKRTVAKPPSFSPSSQTLAKPRADRQPSPHVWTALRWQVAF